MSILFISALPVELTALKKEIQSQKVKTKRGEISFLLSGAGNYNTLYSLQNYLFSHQVDFIVNIGVCGISEKIKETEDIYQAYRIKNLANGKESLVPIYFSFAPLTSLASSEKVITSSEEMSGEDFVDMESFAIDFIATKEKIPYIILKLPFDTVSLGSKDVKKSDIEALFKVVDYEKLLSCIDTFLTENAPPGSESLDNYFEYFRTTFSEKEILKKQFARFQALGFDFDAFFETNKTLPKKDFFKVLQTFNG